MSTSTDFDLIATVTQFLDGCRTASLATADADGRPHAANVQYARGNGDGDSTLTLYWVSDPGSEHSRHLADRPDAGITIYSHDDTATNIHGVQLRGRCEVVPDEEAWGHVWDLYTRKYPVVTTMPQVREMIDDGRQCFYRFTPTWIRWIDNRRGFGWKVERGL